jgi:hypothetical protein
MNTLLTAIKKGFTISHEEKLREWSKIRTLGFWKYWSQRWLGQLIILFVVTFFLTLLSGASFYSQIIGFVLLALMITTVTVVLDYFDWCSKDREWRKEQSN